jgi:hypothetical protein
MSPMGLRSLALYLAARLTVIVRPNNLSLVLLCVYICHYIFPFYYLDIFFSIFFFETQRQKALLYKSSRKHHTICIEDTYQ